MYKRGLWREKYHWFPLRCIRVAQLTWPTREKPLRYFSSRTEKTVFCNTLQYWQLRSFLQAVFPVSRGKYAFKKKGENRCIDGPPYWSRRKPTKKAFDEFTNPGATVEMHWEGNLLLNRFFILIELEWWSNACIAAKRSRCQRAKTSRADLGYCIHALTGVGMRCW
jgi:hypothetical protein